MANSQRTYGIDVSVWQNRVTWSRVSSQPNVKFAITKATQGDFLVDPQFQNNWTGIRNAGLIRGAYHFFSPRIDPIRQANTFLGQIGDTLRPDDFPPILDFEYYPDYIKLEWQRYSVAGRIDRIQRCLDRIERETGRLPMIYTSFSSWQEITGNHTGFTRYPLWVAHYGSSLPGPLMPAGNWGGNGWNLWQYSDSGRVNGVGGNVDENWFNGSVQDLINFIGGNPDPVDILSRLTNKEVYTAFQQVSVALGISVTTLLDRATLRYIADETIANYAYGGPLLKEMNLAQSEKDALVVAATEILAERPDGIPPGFTNQDMIDAFYRAAEQLRLDGWELIIRAGLQELALDRGALYAGPIVSQLSLNDGEKVALKDVIGYDTLGPAAVGPYPGLTNQKMINLFYRAAPPISDAYWNWIERAGLTSMAIPDTNRSLPYSGPKIEVLPGLNNAEKDALLALLLV